MAIPSISELVRPVLEVHRAGQALRIDEIVEALAPLFSLTNEELSERQPSGDATFAQRIGWARHQLIDGELLERHRRGETRITNTGRELLESGEPVPERRGDWAKKPISRESVLAAIDEFDREGRDQTLKKHGFRRALDYVVELNGKEYDSKALYGIAYGIEYPDEDPIRLRGLQGGGTVARRLTDLGFNVIRRSESDAATSVSTAVHVWIVRAGREGRDEQLAIDEGVCVIGWSELGELSLSATREDLKGAIERTGGERRPASLASQAGQIYRFLHEISVGDLVVLPLLSKREHVAIGRVAGDYKFRTDGAFAKSDAVHTRPVEWLATDLPYERFDPDLREAFGQQGTISEIGKPHAAQRIIDVVGGADASAIHLVLKWSPGVRPDTIDLHRKVVEAEGAVWWGRQSKPGTTGLAEEWVKKLRSQLTSGSETFVFLHSGAASTWRTRLLDVATDQSDVDAELVPSYYDPDAFHSLWVKLTDFEEVDAVEITEGYVLAQSGDPVTWGGLGNQTPLIIRKQSATLSGRYFILNQSQGNRSYDDSEGERYHWTSRSSGATKQLASSPGARFIYYRPGTANDGTSKSYFGSGRIGSVAEETIDGITHYIATIEDFKAFDTPVSLADGPPRNAQVSIQSITPVQFEKLVAAGGRANGEPADLTLEGVREAAEQRGLNLAPAIYSQLLAALLSGKHIILTGPPGTAKTTLAQAVAEAAQRAGVCGGYVLTTATADWTTYETIGGLRPTGPDVLSFEEGHFLKAIRSNHWLIVDELNRSHFDRAFGQLFTVLSGQPVTLPYHALRPDPRGHSLLFLRAPRARNPRPMFWRFHSHGA